MKRWLFENLGLKILAFLIAISLWAYVGSRQVLERRISLHLELTDIPVGMTVDSNVKTSIPVVFTGRKDSVLNLDPEELRAVMSLRGTAPTPLSDVLVHPPVKVQPLPSDVAATVPSVTIHLIPSRENRKK